MNRPVYAKAYASSQQSDKTLSKLEFTTNINSTVKVRKGPNPDRLVLRNDTSERVVIATLISGKIFYGFIVLFPNLNSCRNQIPD